MITYEEGQRKSVQDTMFWISLEKPIEEGCLSSSSLISSTNYLLTLSAWKVYAKNQDIIKQTNIKYQQRCWKRKYRKMGTIEETTSSLVTLENMCLQRTRNNTWRVWRSKVITHQEYNIIPRINYYPSAGVHYWRCWSTGNGINKHVWKHLGNFKALNTFKELLCNSICLDIC